MSGGGGDHGHGINWNLVIVAVIVLAVISGIVHVVDRAFPSSGGYRSYDTTSARSSIRNRDVVPDGWSVRR